MKNHFKECAFCIRNPEEIHGMKDRLHLRAEMTLLSRRGESSTRPNLHSLALDVIVMWNVFYAKYGLHGYLVCLVARFHWPAVVSFVFVSAPSVPSQRSFSNCCLLAKNAILYLRSFNSTNPLMEFDRRYKIERTQQ
jgi:hypothetical protein